MKHTKKIVCLILSLLLVLAVFAVPAFAAPDAPALRFKDDGTFTILQIADTQDDMYPAPQLLELLRQSLDIAQPDLVVFTGDQAEDSRIPDFGVDAQPWREGVTVSSFGKTDRLKTRSNVEQALDYVFGPVNDKGIPFAVVQGNNEYSVGIENSDWLEIYGNYENNLTRDESPDSAGRIDYRLPVLSSDGNREAFSLFILDTESSQVTDEQIAWFNEESAKTNTKAFVFQHIPVNETANLFERCGRGDDGAVLYGLQYYKLIDGAHGHFEKAYLSSSGSDAFAAWKAQDNVLAAFFGHMHTEGYTGVYDGIELNLTYGAEFAKGGPWGVRVITLHEGDEANYDNVLYRFTDGKLQPDNGAPGEKTFIQRLEQFFSNLSFLIKYEFRKVVS